MVGPYKLQTQYILKASNDLFGYNYHYFIPKICACNAINGFWLIAKLQEFPFYNLAMISTCELWYNCPNKQEYKKD